MEKNIKFNLNNITLVSVAGIRVNESLKAIKYSCKQINFHSVKLFTHEDIFDSNVETIKIPKLNYEQYNHFILYELHKYIDSEFVLIIQDDGFVINPTSWKDEFLNYDYIGAPFALPQDNFSYLDSRGNLVRVGNGGFSLRSKKLLKVASKLNLPWKSYFGFYNEDGFIVCHNRHIYEEQGCVIAPLEIAKYFSHEAQIPELEGIIPFGFHGKKNEYINLL